MRLNNNPVLTYDCELIGSENPTFLICVKDTETLAFKNYWFKNMNLFARRLYSEDATWIGFNNLHFDNLLIGAALAGADPHTLKAICTDIIENNLPAWRVKEYYRFEVPEFDCVDIKEVAPGQHSLKMYAARMHWKRLQDLPFDPDHDITTAKERKILQDYCRNDCDVTHHLARYNQEALELRVTLAEKYGEGLDLRSKSDAQCAEAIFVKALNLPRRSGQIYQREVRYFLPHWLDKTIPKKGVVRDIATRMCEQVYGINEETGGFIKPEWMDEEVMIDKKSYAIGLGGLHSIHDKPEFLDLRKGEYKLTDFDVTSYYPNILLNNPEISGLNKYDSAQMLGIYRQIYEERLKAKQAGDKATANSLKIVLNGTFGKLKSKFCPFYSPETFLHITLSGQLHLLNLIEKIDSMFIQGEVVSANTDGIMVGYYKEDQEKLEKLFLRNSQQTGFTYEQTDYDMLALRDVSNYFAISPDGKMKRKGAFAPSGVMYEEGAPDADICTHAVIEHLYYGSSLEDIIIECQNMEKFVMVRGIRTPGGGVQHQQEVEIDDWVGEPRAWRRPGWPESRKSLTRVSRPAPIVQGEGGKPFGRIARWYWTTKPTLPITSMSSGNKIPKTDGAMLCLTMPARLPMDLDIDRYIENAHQILKDLKIEQ